MKARATKQLEVEVNIIRVDEFKYVLHIVKYIKMTMNCRTIINTLFWSDKLKEKCQKCVRKSFQTDNTVLIQYNFPRDKVQV